jgi:hypothetical protein
LVHHEELLAYEGLVQVGFQRGALQHLGLHARLEQHPAAATGPLGPYIAVSASRSRPSASLTGWAEVTSPMLALECKRWPRTS